MKMNIAIVITGALLISGSAQAAGWNADIFSGKQDAGTLKWDSGSYATDSGDSYGVGISKQISPRVGLGFEVGYTKNEYSNARPNAISGRYLMLTGEYDFMQRGRFSAYGGLGLGVIKAKYRNNGFSHSHDDSVSGGRLSLGARYAVSARSKLFLEARRIEAFKDPRIAHNGGTGPLVGAEYGGDSLLLGFRYTF